jgi:methionyl-tRNA formyltransferase
MSLMPLNLVFAGTPDFAVPALEALLSAGYHVSAVYTQPDRPAGRGQHLAQSAIKQTAIRHGLIVEQPKTLRDPDAAAHLASYRPDAMIVVAYGLILPQSILDVPRLGCINIHGSLLPRWRGAAPIHRALLAGDAITGISIMRMDAGLDTGPVLSTHPIAIGERATANELHDSLAALGAQALVSTLNSYATGSISPRAQPIDGVTYAQKIRKDEAQLDWRLSAAELDRRIRAFNPWPVAETRWDGQQLRVWEAIPIPLAHGKQPGAVISADSSGIVVAAGDGALSLLRVQLAGRKQMSAADFLNAHFISNAVLGAANDNSASVAQAK